MELNLSRNAAAISKSVNLLADADKMIDECSACLLREVIVSEAQAADHNRSIGEAKRAIADLRSNLKLALDDISATIRRAQITFLETKPNDRAGQCLDLAFRKERNWTSQRYSILLKKIDKQRRELL